jgi:hypothetical protein
MAVGVGHVARALEPVRRAPKEWVAGLRLVALSLECVKRPLCSLVAISQWTLGASLRTGPLFRA